MGSIIVRICFIPYAFFKVEKSKLMNIMRALGLCTYYLKSICISLFLGSIVSLELLILLLGILLKNRSYFLWSMLSGFSPLI